MTLSLDFHPISGACSHVPHGTVQNQMLVSLLLGAYCFYLDKLSRLEPHSISFQGALLRLEARFLTWLITCHYSSIAKVPVNGEAFTQFSGNYHYIYTTTIV
jgi:hypothetical protein